MPSRPLLPACVLALLLVSLVAGCSAYRQVPAARWGEVGPPGEPSGGAKAPLAPGDRVRLTLRGGCACEGRLVRSGPDSLVVAGARALPRADAEFGGEPCRGFAGGDTVTVAVADLGAVERLEPRSVGSVLTGTVGISMSLLIVLLFAASRMDWGSN